MQPLSKVGSASFESRNFVATLPKCDGERGLDYVQEGAVTPSEGKR